MNTFDDIFKQFGYIWGPKNHWTSSWIQIVWHSDYLSAIYLYGINVYVSLQILKENDYFLLSTQRVICLKNAWIALLLLEANNIKAFWYISLFRNLHSTFSIIFIWCRIQAQIIQNCMLWFISDHHHWEMLKTIYLQDKSSQCLSCFDFVKSHFIEMLPFVCTLTMVLLGSLFCHSVCLFVYNNFTIFKMFCSNGLGSLLTC